jgi:tetratricopeptide (TPR) repeat protein
MTPERWRRINDLFHAALERPAADADAFLRESCAGDVELYSEVRRMLDQATRTGPLDQSPWSPISSGSGPAPTPAPEAPPAFEPGQTISGRFRIVRFLNRGGMGEVYEAEDTELRERIAIKTLLPVISSDVRMIARFKQELQLCRKIGHPNVCRVFDLFRHPADRSGSESATYFLTMELLAGETLSACMHREGAIAADRALGILEQIAAALDAAHAAGIIHRDLKPSNVLLVPASGGMRAVVTDFGLARSFTPGEQTGTHTTHLMGTVEYMAPELFTGRPASVASDIYALGLVAYKMVTGAFPADTPSMAQSLDANWRRTLDRALSPDPGARCKSAREFIGGLRGANSTSTSIIVNLPGLTKRRVLIGTAAVVLLGGFPAGWQQWTVYRDRPSAEALALYDKGLDNSHAGAWFAATKAFDQAIRLAPRFALAHVQLAEAWLELLVPEKAKDEMLAARRLDLSSLSDRDRLQAEAVDLAISRDFRAAVDKYEQLRRRFGPAFDIDLGRAFDKASRSPDALAVYTRATQADPRNAAAWLRLAVLSSRMSKPEQAAAAFDRAAGLYDNNLEGLIQVAFERGTDALRHTHYDEATRYFQQALDSARLGANVQQQVAAMLQLATVAYVTGDADRAEQYAADSIRLARANQLDALAVSGLVNLGNAYAGKNNFSAAEQAFRDALALAERTGAHRLEAMGHFSLASLYNRQARGDGVYREALVAQEYFRQNQYFYEAGACLILVARYHLGANRQKEALDAFTDAGALAAKAQNANIAAQARAGSASVLMAQERFPQALEQYRANLAPDADPVLKRFAGLQCGHVLTLLGRGTAAREVLAQAELAGAADKGFLLKIRRARAELALIEGKPVEAAAQARDLLTATSPALDQTDAATCERVLGLALLASGKKQEGRAHVEEALRRTEKISEPAMLLEMRLAALAAHLDTGDRRGALGLFEKVNADISPRPESRWRASALMARAGLRPAAEARDALSALASSWKDAAAYKDYLARPDLQSISRHLFQTVPATH